MNIAIMLSVLVLSTDDQYVAIELTQLQGFELVDKALNNGGICEFYLKDRKESIIFPVSEEEDFKKVKDFLDTNILSISRLTNRREQEVTVKEVGF